MDELTLNYNQIEMFVKNANFNDFSFFEGTMRVPFSDDLHTGIIIINGITEDIYNKSLSCGCQRGVKLKDMSIYTVTELFKRLMTKTNDGVFHVYYHNS